MAKEYRFTTKSYTENEMVADAVLDPSDPVYQMLHPTESHVQSCNIIDNDVTVTENSW